MPKISKDIPLAEITLRKYEKPTNLKGRDLVRKLCLSIGLLQPGDSRDVIVDILNVMNWVLEEDRYPVHIIDQVYKNHSFVIESVIKENSNLIGFAMYALYGDAYFRSMRFVQRYVDLNSFRFGPNDLLLALAPFKKEKIEIINADRNQPVQLGKLSEEAQIVFDKLPEYQPGPNDCPNDEWLSKHGKNTN